MHVTLYFYEDRDITILVGLSETLLISTNSITIRPLARDRSSNGRDHHALEMVSVCPNTHCGQVFPTAVGLSNHIRSRKCKGAKAAASAKRRRLENEQQLANPQVQSTDENVQEQEQSHNQPENFAVPEVTIRFHNPID